MVGFVELNKLNNIKIKKISSKVLVGNFGKGRYFGYKKKKITSLIEITTNYNSKSFGESLVGIYSPKLFEINLNYISKFLLNKNIYQSLKILETFQVNKFFFSSGLLKSIISSIQLGIFNLISDLYDETLSQTLNRMYFSNKNKIIKKVPIYSSAGSIKANLSDLKKDIEKAKKLKIDNIKIRIDLNSNYQKKILLLRKNNFRFALDLIANTYEKNRNDKKLNEFIKFTKKYKPLWVEEPINIEDFNKFKNYNFGKIKISYGENFNSNFDFYNLIKFYKFDFINIDICHFSIIDIVKLIKYLKQKKIKKKILLHCWGGIINLHTSLELSRLFYDYVYMTEFPIADYDLNDEYIQNSFIKNSFFEFKSSKRFDLNKYYIKKIKPNFLIKPEKYEFKF